MAESLMDLFSQNGYVVLRKHFSEEYVWQLKEEARKIIGSSRPNKSGVYLGMSKASPLFRRTAAHPGLVDALKEIIGNHIIFLSDKIVFKDAGTDFGSPWHQDYPYWLGSHKYSVWIALDDAAPNNGCLRVLPGSHKFGAVNHGDEVSDEYGFDNRIRQNEINQEQIVDLPASQGDAIIFHDLLFHSSYPNTSGKDRWALISTYKDGTQDDPDYEWSGGAFTVSG